MAPQRRSGPTRFPSAWGRPAAAAGVLAALALAGFWLPVKDAIEAFLTWTRGLGTWGPAVVAGLYILAALALVPGSLLTLGAGFLFGLGAGVITVSVGATLGAAAAFLTGRYLARDWIAGMLAGHPRLAALDEALGREGFKLVLLLRLSPLFPFNLLNYALGLTRVSFGHYLLASWLGMLPGTLMYVYLGSAARSLAALAAGEFQGGPWQLVMFWAGLAAAVLAAVLITRIAARALGRIQPLQDERRRR